MKRFHYVAAALMLFGAHPVRAQAAAGTSPGGGGAKDIAKAAMHTPACQSIIAECKSLGFIVGQAKEDNGLWKDCFGPVVKGGGTPTRDGKPINVPVNPNDVQACKAALFGSGPAAAPPAH